MGKGDRKTRKGKIFKGSYGRRRPKNKSKMVSYIEAGIDKTKEE